MKAVSGWLLVLVLVAALSAVAQKPAVGHGEQTRFSAEDESVKRPVTVPPEVLERLSQERWIRNSMKAAEPRVEELPSSWLLASIVHLAGPREDDLIVMAAGPLRGANVTTFWIFRPTEHGYQLAATAPAHDLVIQEGESKGLRSIGLLSATGNRVHTVELRFDGEKYAPTIDKWEEIP